MRRCTRVILVIRFANILAANYTLEQYQYLVANYVAEKFLVYIWFKNFPYLQTRCNLLELLPAFGPHDVYVTKFSIVIFWSHCNLICIQTTYNWFVTKQHTYLFSPIWIFGYLFKKDLRFVHVNQYLGNYLTLWVMMYIRRSRLILVVL